jgi:hypothetical protein
VSERGRGRQSGGQGGEREREREGGREPTRDIVFIFNNTIKTHLNFLYLCYPLPSLHHPCPPYLGFGGGRGRG